MERSWYNENMPVFCDSRGREIKPDDSRFDEIIKEWAHLIKHQNNKGLIPLFITGCGVSYKVVPDIVEIIKTLESEYKKRSIPKPDVDNLFNTEPLAKVYSVS